MPSYSKKRRGKRPVAFEPLESRRLLSAAVSPLLTIDQAADPSTSIQGYTPSQISTAYDFNSVLLPGGGVATGAGETIAIVDAYNDPKIANNLKTFDKEFDLPTPLLTVVSQTGSKTVLPQSDAGWDSEIALDVEWAHAIAPGAKILLVEANSDSTSDLIAGVAYAESVPSVSVVSMSWGGSEFPSETSDDADFVTPSGHQGITFVAASGDDGVFNGAEWPASSPDVLGVGGTSLTLSSNGTYVSETPWSDSSGGYSQVESELSYQSDVQTTGYRSAPDVAYDADPNTGVAVYDSIEEDGTAGWQEIGGTSEGAPQWAALIALADQVRAAKGLGSLNGADQTLPTLYAEYSNATTDAAAFNQVSGSNVYTDQTGLGSPVANVVVSDLASATTTTPTVVPIPTSSQPPTHSRGVSHHHGHGWGGFFAVDNVEMAVNSAPAKVHAIDPAAVGVSEVLSHETISAEHNDVHPVQAAVESALPISVAAPVTITSAATTESRSVLVINTLADNAPVAATSEVQSIPGLRAAGLFSTVPLRVHAAELLELPSIPGGKWATALAAGVLFGAYVADRKGRHRRAYGYFAPLQNFT